MNLLEIIDRLEKDYPDKISALKDKSPEEIKVYLAKLSMIEYIKTLAEVRPKTKMKDR